MEATKRNKYVSDYHAQGLAFAPLVSNSFGQFGPDLLRLLWRLADHAAHHHLPSALQAAPVLDPAVNSQLQATHKRLRGHIYVQSTYKLLAAVFEGITERIYGRTFAFKTLPRYQEIIAARSQPWLLPTPPSPPPAAFPPPAAALAHCTPPRATPERFLPLAALLALPPSPPLCLLC